MSDNLNLPQVSPTQNNKETTINDATTKLSGALTDTLSCDLSSGSYTLTDDNFQSYMKFATTGNTVARAFTVPSIKRALFMVTNGGTSTVTITVGTTTIPLAAGATNFYQTDGTSNGLASAIPTSQTGVEMDLCVAISGLPGASQNIPIVMNQAITVPISLTGSNFAIGTNPTSTMTFVLKKNGSSIGSVAFSTGGSATVTFTAAVSFAIGDVFTITAPGSQDATGADVSLNFKASRN